MNANTMQELLSNSLELFPINKELNNMLMSYLNNCTYRFNPYNFKCVNSDTLLVTLGDSWTWGMEVAGYHDFVNFQLAHWEISQDVITNTNPDRINNLFGYTISDTIKADWLNLGVPALGNMQIANQIQTLSNVIPSLTYSKIIIIVTLTEVGRWFNTECDTALNHSEILKIVEQTNNPDQLLCELNRFVIKQILSSLTPFPHCNLLVGTNFVDAIGLDELPEHQYLTTPWYKLLNIEYPTRTYITNELAWSNLMRSADDGLIPKDLHLIVKPWLLDLIDSAEKSSSKLLASEYIYNCTNMSAHPTKEGHRIWANYILDHLNAKNS